MFRLLLIVLSYILPSLHSKTYFLFLFSSMTSQWNDKELLRHSNVHMGGCYGEDVGPPPTDKPTTSSPVVTMTRNDVIRDKGQGTTKQDLEKLVSFY